MPSTKRKAPATPTPSSAAKRSFGKYMMKSPEILLSSGDCKAQVLSVSDQHAIVLLETTQRGEEETPVKSLLKLTVQTFHKKFLEKSEYDGANEAAVTPEISKQILLFLSNYSFRRTSESGAEYSYYDATPKVPAPSVTSSAWNALTGFGRSLFFLGGSNNSNSTTPQVFTAFQAELISPASYRQIQRVLPSAPFRMIHETPEVYDKVVKPWIQSMVQDGSLSWVKNVVEGKKEKERLLLDNDDYILNIDTKWKSHPDPLTIPREEWMGHKATEDLYCLAIVKNAGLTSLRDLRSEHVPMLQSILEECPRVIEEVYGVSSHQLRIFVHYHPQFYQFHVHFTRLENEFGCQAERAHLLSDIVQNLEMDDEYYAKKIISYKLRASDNIYRMMEEANKNSISNADEATLPN